jgi:hypothetical protein
MAHTGEMSRKGRICASGRDTPTNRDRTHMGQRGSNAFKRNDAIRALQSARDGGLEPVMMEVILGPDGTTTFRVHGDNAVLTETT